MIYSKWSKKFKPEIREAFKLFCEREPDYYPTKHNGVLLSILLCYFQQDRVAKNSKDEWIPSADDFVSIWENFQHIFDESPSRLEELAESRVDFIKDIRDRDFTKFMTSLFGE